VLLHLNGAKIAGPTVLGRKPATEVRSLVEGHGYEVLEVTGDDLPGMHHRFAEALAIAYGKIVAIQHGARAAGRIEARPRWPAIILRTPKGWTGPKEVDGVVVTGTWRSHQVPLSGVRGNPEHLGVSEEWLRSYRSEELFDGDGTPVPTVLAANPRDAENERVAARERWVAHSRARHTGLPPIRRSADLFGDGRGVDPPVGRDDGRAVPA
jgi:xylulose-5-phosphate/fructose-6-phosphate phosphoketolase